MNELILILITISLIALIIGLYKIFKTVGYIYCCLYDIGIELGFIKEDNE